MITDAVQKTTLNNALDNALDNGLRVLTRAVHSAPVVSFWVWYRVGSRNERPGLTGLSHWVEHMLFKGTPTHPHGAFDRMVQREGGYCNGMTWLDWTTYYETLPSDRIDLALRIEADRMVNSLFNPVEVESERTVIIAEREGNENRPTYQLHEQVQAHSFVAHPYRHMVIGWKEDLRSIRRDDLYQHYRSFYAPNNAIVVAVGDFDSPAMIARIAELFGSIPAGRAPAPAPPAEPPARAERRLHISGPSGASYLSLSYLVPGAGHPDFFPLVVLDAVLSGAKGMPPFGGAGLGRSARLYRALVNTGLAVSAGSSLSATIDPYLFTISVTAHPQRTPPEASSRGFVASAQPSGSAQGVEAAVFAELQRLQETPVAEDELRKAIKGATAQFVYGSESVTNQAMWLGFSAIVTSTTWLAEFLDRLAAVTSEDVQRVARAYLTTKNRVVGWYTPEGSAA